MPKLDRNYPRLTYVARLALANVMKCVKLELPPAFFPLPSRDFPFLAPYNHRLQNDHYGAAHHLLWVPFVGRNPSGFDIARSTRPILVGQAHSGPDIPPQAEEVGQNRFGLDVSFSIS
jgi:hypothetical protein